jgi:predicted nucleotidyltransferase
MKVMDKTEFGLSEETVKKIRKVFSSFTEVEEAVIYGSRAKGNYKPGSDIDFTLKGDKLTRNILSSINIKLDDLLLPYIIDTSIFTEIDNKNLLDHIKSIGKVFYRKQ